MDLRARTRRRRRSPAQEALLARAREELRASTEAGRRRLLAEDPERFFATFKGAREDYAALGDMWLNDPDALVFRVAQVGATRHFAKALAEHRARYGAWLHDEADPAEDYAGGLLQSATPAERTSLRALLTSPTLGGKACAEVAEVAGQLARDQNAAYRALRRLLNAGRSPEEAEGLLARAIADANATQAGWRREKVRAIRLVRDESYRALRREVLARRDAGETAGEIARGLKVSPPTIRKYLKEEEEIDAATTTPDPK